jgi:hypothetical protein
MVYYIKTPRNVLHLLCVFLKWIDLVLCIANKFTPFETRVECRTGIESWPAVQYCY